MGARFAGRRVLVTGASRGIGAALATRFAAEAADVAIVARTLERHDHLAGSLAETAARMEGFGNQVAVIVADLADGEDRARIVPEAEAALGGPIDVLVNNAAAAIYAPTSTYPLKRRRITFEVNVHAPLDLAQAVIPGMVDRREGWIVNVSSASSKLSDGPPFRREGVALTLGIYGASKAALNRETNCLAAELHGTGIRVNTIEPRAAVLSEGANELVGDQLSADQIESMESMVEATLALCDCGPDLTGRVTVSTELIAELGLTVMTLDGTAPAPA
jgi:NAD(P)-dependent dehydrogenase (short-subunit alcohol dehydrogenase family)